MEITELKALNSGKYRAVLSDGSAVMVTTAMIADLSLYSGRELTDEEFNELFAAAQLSACKERSLRIIGMRPMSCKELYDRLVEKGEMPENAAACVAWLLDLRYLDDGLYAGMLVRHNAAKGYGVGRIRNELYRRGIPKELWDDALEEMPETEDKVYDLLCRKLRNEEPDRAEMKKATDSLFRRGFSWTEIKAAVNRFKSDNENCD
ncbi:MAG: regulatory protein RecX [Oscillospiraceae bacterium]